MRNFYLRNISTELILFLMSESYRHATQYVVVRPSTKLLSIHYQLQLALYRILTEPDLDIPKLENRYTSDSYCWLRILVATTLENNYTVARP